MPTPEDKAREKIDQALEKAGWKVEDTNIGGGTPSKANPEYWAGSIPWLTVKDMRTRRPENAIDHISADAVRDSATNIIPADTVIIATRIGLGKVIRVPYDSAINQDLKALIARPEVEKGYLEYWILSIAEYLQSIGSGTTVKGIRLEQLRALPFPLAPLNEQKRILAEIEKQFSRLDEAVANLKRIKVNLKRYKAAVLKAAVEGKLTEDWRKTHPNVEPASKLLERIFSERRVKWNGKGPYKEPTKPETSSLPPLPKSWIWTNLGQMFNICIGATPSRGKAEYWNGTIPWVSSGEVAFCRIRETREHITQEGLANSSTEIHSPGTVLLGMIGEGKTRGQAAILGIAACNNQNAAAIHVSETGIPPEYVYRYLEGQYEKNRSIGSGNNQPALNKARVQGIPLPLPPISEQQQIVAEVERRLSVIDELEAAVEANLTRADRLRQAVLQKAFSGQLMIGTITGSLST
jgi:type I restriction enzyme, S subunit